MNVALPLARWYPQLERRWRVEGRRLPVPRSERIGFTIHHTDGGATTDPTAYARAVADDHFRRWSRPGGYNFLVGTDGVAREMCGWDFVGAHAPTCNRNRIGIAFQGNYARVLPSDRMITTALALIASGPVPNRQNGHRDCSATVCPGGTLYDALPLRPPSGGGEEEEEMSQVDHGSTGALRRTHASEPPAWAREVWEAYVAAGGTNTEESVEWPAWRYDVAWLYLRFVRPLERRNEELEKRVRELERRVEGLVTEGAGVTELRVREIVESAQLRVK